MKKALSVWLIIMALSFGFFVRGKQVVAQQTISPSSSPAIEEATDSANASASAEATGEASLASPSAETVQKIQEKKDQDITEPTGEQKSKLVRYLEENPVGEPSVTNILERAIRNAVKEGVPPNVIVLVLLFPLVSSFIAASRHIIGLRGFGIYIPAVLSVALASTGLLEGLAVFLAIVGVALPAKRALRRTKLPYLPRTAILLWFVSLAILTLLLATPFLNLVSIMTVNIFPILILVLLAENFLDAQGKTKPSDAIALTVETLGLAFLSGLILKWETLQKFALLEPELLVIGIFLFNLVIGKFVGLRFTEYFRFRTMMEEE